MSEQNTMVAVGSHEEYARAVEYLRESASDFLASIETERSVAAELAKVIASGCFLEHEYDEWGFLTQSHKECADEIGWAHKRVISAIVAVAKVTEWAPHALTKAYEFGIHDPNLMAEASHACENALRKDEDATHEFKQELQDEFLFAHEEAYPDAVGRESSPLHVGQE